MSVDVSVANKQMSFTNPLGGGKLIAVLFYIQSMPICFSKASQYLSSKSRANL